LSVVPEDDFSSQIKIYNIYITATILFLLLLGIYFISLFSKQISAPINKLANELEQIRYLNITPSPPIKTHIIEVNTIYRSMESMKIGLESFRKYLPEKLVRNLITSGEAAKIGGKIRPLTLIFSDITDFTLISEKISADEIMIYLCEYFNEISLVINQYNGTIDKFIGDSVMAFWGAPLEDNHGIEKACFSALECLKRIDLLNIKWLNNGILFATRFGIHHGDAIIGNIGSEDRLNYTAIGDTVNLTSRFEELNKYYGSKIIVSEAIYQKVNDLFLFRILDIIILKGHAAPITIYQLFQQKNIDINSKLLEFCEFYTKGFSAYKQQDWDAAISQFEYALLIDPEDVASRLMITRCQKFKLNPPPSGWHGIWVYAN
jgi:adenylate cyclase